MAGQSLTELWMKHTIIFALQGCLQLLYIECMQGHGVIWALTPSPPHGLLPPTCMNNKSRVSRPFASPSVRNILNY